MQENGIRVKTKRKFKATTKSPHDFLVVDNLLKRRFSTEAANRVWFSDITFVWTKEGWIYLAAILDAYDRQIVGWSMADRLSHGILDDALYKALRKRKPEAGLIFHSDQGTRHASCSFRDLMD